MVGFLSKQFIYRHERSERWSFFC